MSERSSPFFYEFSFESKKMRQFTPTIQRSLQEDSQITTFGKCSQNILDFSFENNASNQNIEAIHKAWHHMIASCLEKDTQKPCQDSQDFRKVFVIQEKTCEKKFKEVVLKNHLLSNQQKKHMIKSIHNESILASNLLKLSQLFEQQCYDQILYLAFYIWKQFQDLISSKKSHNFLFKNIFPRIFDLDDYKEEEYTQDESKIYQQQILKNMDVDEILKAAQKTSQKLAMNFYLQANLKILLFKDCQQLLVQGVNLLKQFVKFFEVLCKAIFLSAANFYQYYDDIMAENLYKRSYENYLESFGNILSEDFFGSQDESEIPPRKLRKIF